MEQTQQWLVLSFGNLDLNDRVNVNQFLDDWKHFDYERYTVLIHLLQNYLVPDPFDAERSYRVARLSDRQVFQDSMLILKALQYELRIFLKAIEKKDKLLQEIHQKYTEEELSSIRNNFILPEFLEQTIQTEIGEELSNDYSKIRFVLMGGITGDLELTTRLNEKFSKIYYQVNPHPTYLKESAYFQLKPHYETIEVLFYSDLLSYINAFKAPLRCAYCDQIIENPNEHQRARSIKALPVYHRHPGDEHDENSCWKKSRLLKDRMRKKKVSDTNGTNH